MLISEAYLRIEINLNDSQKREIGATILRIAENGAHELFASYETPRIGEAVVEDGSTKLRARIRTSALALLGFVGAYGTVRTGIDYMRRDGKLAAGWMVDQVEPALPKPSDLRRRRAPASTRLRRLFERVEAGELSATEASERADEILREYREAPETVRIVVQRLADEFRSIQPTASAGRSRPPIAHDTRQATPIRAGKRLSVFRDPRTGAVVYVEQ